VAANLAALGAKVSLFGGNWGGRSRRAICAGPCPRLGMPARACMADARRITTSRRASSRVTSRWCAWIASSARPWPFRLEQIAHPAHQGSSLPKLDVLVVSDYDKGVVTDALAERVLEECHRRGVPTLVKPKTSRLIRLSRRHGHRVQQEGSRLFRHAQLSDEKSIEEAGRALLAHFGCAAVVITLGEAMA
jgi:bifunctional ADP-heptose synthase (sugar kinase/adenylyltransferase)